MKRIHTILDKYEKQVDKSQLKQIASYLKELGFNKLAQTLPEIEQVKWLLKLYLLYNLLIVLTFL